MAFEEYTGGERRSDDRRGEGGLVLRAMDITQNLITAHMEQERTKLELLDSRINDLQDRLGSIVTLIDKYMDTHNHVLNAFPAGDIVGHKEAHESWLKESEERKAFWKKLQLELTKWSLLAIVGWAGLAVWHEFLRGPQ